MSDLVDARGWLDGHVNLESLGAPPGIDRRAAHPTLDRIDALMSLLGSPQLDEPFIHLTGTNGKTSVARMATALLVAHGLSVGAYTSPHLERVNERITWGGQEISDEALDALLALIAQLEPHLPGPPSFFEILTAAALRFFADVAVEVGVVEVGVGGTWDATNVVDGRVAIVTNVTIDHVEYLGPTRADIAAEKAGIVKAGSILVLGETDPDLRATFEARGAAEVWVRDRDFRVTENRLAHGGRFVGLETPGARYPEMLLSLHGAHQADNAAIALAGVEAFLGRPLEDDVVAEVFASVRSPGRLEVVAHQPLVLLDGAHNVAGAQALRVALEEEFPAGPRTLVVGLLREKDPAEMLDALDARHCAQLVCCRPPSPRALDPTAVADAAITAGLDAGQVEVVDDVGAAVAEAIRRAGPSGQVVVTGSLYVVGAARSAVGMPVRPSSRPGVGRAAVSGAAGSGAGVGAE
jgi:dihydrofolate synthase/folylpolyglutamate synthase